MQHGHWIKDCPLSVGTGLPEIKKATGIPRSFMVPVEKGAPGALLTPAGDFVVPQIDL